MNKKFDETDWNYVVSVLKGRTASDVCDGDLDPPQGARCKTRSGFKAWLARYNKIRAARGDDAPVTA